VTGAKIKPGTITGTQINLATLGTVPTANLANSLAPMETAHLIGAPGEPGFQNGWKDAPPEGTLTANPAGFYKDHDGVVHLQGAVIGGTVGKPIFELPPGFRPAAGRFVLEPGVCIGPECGPSTSVAIFGSNIPVAGGDGAVFMGKAAAVGLDGITFRAES
jgi:hypothetical protein